MGSGKAIAIALTVIVLVGFIVYNIPQLMPPGTLPEEAEKTLYSVSRTLHDVLDRLVEVVRGLGGAGKETTKATTTETSVPAGTVAPTPSTTSTAPRPTPTATAAEDMSGNMSMEIDRIIAVAKNSARIILSVADMIERHGLPAYAWRASAGYVGDELARIGALILIDKKRALSEAKSLLNYIGDVEEYADYAARALRVLDYAENVTARAQLLLDQLHGVPGEVLGVETHAPQYYAELLDASRRAKRVVIEVAQSLLSYPPAMVDLDHAVEILESVEKTVEEIGEAVNQVKARLTSLLVERTAMLQSRIRDLASMFKEAPLPLGLRDYVARILGDVDRAVSRINAEAQLAHSLSRLAVVAKALTLVERDVELASRITSGWEKLTPRPSITVGDGMLVLRVPGTVDAVAFYPVGSAKPVLVVWTYHVREGFEAARVKATPLYTVVEIPAQLILDKLEPGEYYVAAMAPTAGSKLSPAVRFKVKVGENVFIDMGFDGGGAVYRPCSSNDPYRVALLCKSTWSQAALTLLAVYSHYPRSLPEALWMLLNYTGTHIEYNVSRAGSSPKTIYSPLELLERRSGICSDYAVFSQAALRGFTGDSQVIVIPAVNHAALLVEGAGLIVDQHPPPIPVQKYLELLGVGGSVEVYTYRLWMDENMLPLVFEEKTRASSLPGRGGQGAPLDVVARMASRKAADMLVMSYCSPLETVVRGNIAYTSLELRLSWYIGSTRKTVNMLELYTSIPEWVDYLASLIARIVKENYPEALKAHGVLAAWLRAGRLLVYAAPTPCMRIAVVEKDQYLLVSVKPRTDIGIAIADNRGNIILAVARPGYKYRDMKYINADKWLCSETGCIVFIDLEVLEKTLGRGSYSILVWAGKWPVYSHHLYIKG